MRSLILATSIPDAILDHERVADPQRLAVDLEGPIAVPVLDPVVITNRQQLRPHLKTKTGRIAVVSTASIPETHATLLPATRERPVHHGDLDRLSGCFHNTRCDESDTEAATTNGVARPARSSHKTPKALQRQGFRSGTPGGIRTRAAKMRVRKGSFDRFRRERSGRVFNGVGPRRLSKNASHDAWITKCGEGCGGETVDRERYPRSPGGRGLDVSDDTEAQVAGRRRGLLPCLAETGTGDSTTGGRGTTLP